MHPAIYPVIRPVNPPRGQVAVYGTRRAGDGRYAHRTAPDSVRPGILQAGVPSF